MTERLDLVLLDALLESGKLTDDEMKRWNIGADDFSRQRAKEGK